MKCSDCGAPDDQGCRKGCPSVHPVAVEGFRDHVIRLRRSILACELTHREAKLLIDTIETRVWGLHEDSSDL